MAPPSNSQGLSGLWGFPAHNSEVIAAVFRIRWRPKLSGVMRFTPAITRPHARRTSIFMTSYRSSKYGAAAVTLDILFEYVGLSDEAVD